MSRLRGWNAAVMASAALLALLVLMTGVGWLASQRSQTTSYAISSPLTRIDLHLSSGRAVIVGATSPAVEVRRTADFAFGHSAREQRSISGQVLRIDSGCPRIVVGSCSASYEIAVPESVAVNVQTTAGDVRVTDFRGAASLETHSGNVDVEAYCGFNLSASSGSGDVRVATACAPARLDLRSGSGNALALVPPGRYRIRATSGRGRQRIRGVVRSDTAPFTIDVHSGSGSVAVEGGL
ncbi:MAG: DUF4097 family beta strand repeat-containing protein [Solirubrobacteraceae bacterium]